MKTDFIHLTQAAKDRLVTDLNELSISTQWAGGANPISVLNLVDIVAKDLQKKAPPSGSRIT